MKKSIPAIRTSLLTLLLGLIPTTALAQVPTVKAVVNSDGGIELSPGMKVWIAGTNFGRTIKTSTATVQVAGRSIGILDVSAWFGGNSIIGDLLVVQLPADLDPGVVPLVVTVEGRPSAPFNLALDQYVPVLLVYRAGPAFVSPGASKGAIQRVLPNGSYAFLSCLPGETAKPGETLVTYALGLGATDPLVPDMTPAPASPPARTLVTPGILIGGQQSEVLESLLDPGEFGVYRVTFKVPVIGDGPQTFALSIGGEVANGHPILVGKSLSHYLEDTQADVGAAESSIVAESCGGPLATFPFARGDPQNPPEQLGGATVRVKDSAAVSRIAPLLATYPDRLEYIIPAGTANGSAVVTITTGDGSVFTGRLAIQTVVPRIFRYPNLGYDDSTRAPAGIVVRVRDGKQTVEPIATINDDCYYGCLVAIDLGPESDQLFLLLFGTGLRHRSSLANVNVRIGGVDTPVEYAGAQGEFAGTDQVNVRLPRSLVGRGTVPVEVTVDGKLATISQTYFLQFK
jgi:uncharacterized protein (TIGR03437 family)